MVNIIIGFVLGFIVATVGFSGVISYLDQNLNAAKETIDNLYK